MLQDQARFASQQWVSSGQPFIYKPDMGKGKSPAGDDEKGMMDNKNDTNQPANRRCSLIRPGTVR